MATTLIKLDDGTLIEVDVPDNLATPVAGGFATKINETVDSIRPTLLTICRPLIDTWKVLNTEVNVEQAEVELSLSFDFEGNLYITKAKTGASIKVKLVFKPALSNP